MSLEIEVLLVGLLAAGVAGCGDPANWSDDATNLARTGQCTVAADCEPDAGREASSVEEPWDPPKAEVPNQEAGLPDTGGSPGPTMYTSGRHLYDACGERVVLLGVNHPTLWVDRPGEAMGEIARTGANAVRIFWGATRGVPIAEAESAVAEAVDNGMFPMLEMHDATGPGRWGNMNAIVDYWTSPEAVSFIAKHEQYLMVNIANEAGPASGQSYDDFENVYRNAVTRIRDAGIRVPLVIDASGWGRDYQVLFDKGPALIEADPERNLVFSAHLYDPMSRSQIAEILQAAVDMDLPFIIGEFANRSPNGSCGPDIDYLGMIAEANARDIGWLAWSWGNGDPDVWWNGDCWEFDMTRTFSYDTLERWGLEVAVSDPASIQNNAVRTQFLIEGACQ
jgi:mannan endo-1,4-beta-mannosidase